MKLTPDLKRELAGLLCQIPLLRSRDARTAFFLEFLPEQIVESLPQRSDICKSDLIFVISAIDSLQFSNQEWMILLLVDRAIEHAKGLAVVEELCKKRAAILRGIEAEEKPADASLTAQPGEYDELIIAKDDKLPVGFLRKGVQAALSVAKIIVSSTLGNIFSGTAWMIAGGIMITNRHVIAARNPGEPVPTDEDMKTQARWSRLLFDFEEGKDCQEFAVEELLAYDSQLDYALIRVANTSAAGKSLDEYGVLPLVPSQPKLVPGTKLNIIQHPGGRKKEVAIRTNFYIGENSATNRLYYLTDTEGGSSGSPVMNDFWQVIALHRGWEDYRKYYKQQPIRFYDLGLDYKINPTLSNDAVTAMNEGVAIHAILKSLREELRNTILQDQHIS